MLREESQLQQVVRISGAEIADQAVTNAKVNNSAAIAGTKISPDFGSQAIATTNDSVTIGDSIIHAGDTDTKIRFSAADTVYSRNWWYSKIKFIWK